MGEPPGRPIKQKIAAHPAEVQRASRRTVNGCRRRSNLTMADWDTRLTFAITPKSGPLREMVRLRDAQQALIADLPPGYLKRVHWLRASACLVSAAETGKPRDVEWAFEAIVAAMVEEGWLPQNASHTPRSEPPRFSEPRRFESPRSNITARRPAEPLWRPTHSAGTDGRADGGQQQASTSAKPGPKDLEQFVREYLLFL
jgi:hypothetical protein